jgi:hypothetical protein
MNTRREEVGYRPFDVSPVLQQGILPIARDDGSLERRVAEGLARVADAAFSRAESDAQYFNAQKAQQDVLAGGPQPSTITGGEPVDTQKGYRVSVAPENIRAILTEAAKRNGEDPATLMEIARIESNFDPNARNPNSTAGGLLQFIDSTARQYGLRDKFDASQSAEAGARLLSDNRRLLEGRLGRQVTAGELYLAHQQGAGGALKLLSNPNARAADLVGLQSVTLNGGRADMTAAEFASLWTSKVHDGGTKMDPVDRDGPIRITPVKATWRPTGQNTIAGRAYDIAGTRTYLQMAKMTILEDQAQVFDRYKDDPVKLKAAMGQLLEAHRRDGNILPEIEPEYVLSFQQNAFDLQRQAQSQFEQRQQQQDLADYNARLSGLEDRKSQLMAGMDPRNPQTSDALASIQSDIDSHYDSAVSRRLMTPEQARQAKAASRSDMTVGYYLKQTAGLKSDEIEQLATKMTADYAAGKLAGVTAEDWAKIDAGFRSTLAARRAGDDKANADLTSRGNDMAARILKGETVAPSELARMRTDAQTAPQGAEILAATEVRMKLSAALRTRHVGEVEAGLGEILKRADGTVKPEDVDYARDQIVKHRERITKDPLGAAESMGLVPPVAPITLDGMKDPAALRDALSARWGSAVAASNHFGVPKRFFRPGEAEQLASMAMADPDAMVAFTLNVAQSFGKDTPEALREISENGPIMAHAVGLSIATGDASLARDVAKISVMKAKKELDVKVPGDMLAIRAGETLSGALMAQPELQNAAIGTAKLLFEKMAADQGFDPATVKDPASVASAAWEKALDRALGGQTMNGDQYGGLGTVNDRPIVVPAFMKKDQVESTFYGMTEAQLAKLAPRGTINGIEVTAAQMKDGYLVSVGDGLYRVALNDPSGDDPAYVIDKTGKPWVLDIKGLEAVQKDAPYEPYRPGRLSNPGQN